MHWLIWVAGGLVGLYLVSKFVLFPVGMEVGKQYLGQAYDRASPEKKKKFMAAIDEEAKKAKTPEERKVVDMFRGVDSWSSSNYAATSLFANSSERLLI